MSEINSVDSAAAMAADEFIEKVRKENMALFEQCEYIPPVIDAIAKAFPHLKPLKIKGAVLAEFGKSSGKSVSAMRDRYVTGRVFGGQWAEDKDYSLHCTCSYAAGVDADDPSTHHIAHEWMIEAIRQGYTTRTLKAAMRGKKAAPKPIRIEAEIVTFNNHELTLTLSGDYSDLAALPREGRVFVIYPQATAELEAAA